MRKFHRTPDHVRTRRENKKHLNRAFRVLRGKGLLAKQAFSCCMGCALAKLDPMLKQLAEEGKPARGVVYYHQQDAEYFDGDRSTLSIRFATADGKRTAAFGREVLKVLKTAGIEASWNGKADHCIEVTLDKVAA